jgi:hypothetical protein
MIARHYFRAAICAAAVGVLCDGMASAADAPTRAGLVGYWPLDEGGGTLLADRSGRQVPGTNVGGQWANGPAGSALEFVRTKQRVDIPHRPHLGPTEALTIEIWVRPTFLKGPQAIVSKGSTDAVSGYNLIQEDGRVGLLLCGAEKSRYRIVSREPVLTEQCWSHLAATYDVAANRTVIYHNGKEVQRGAAAGRIMALPPVTGRPYATLPLRVGVMSASPYLWEYRGMVRELRIYDRALTAAEVRADYQASRAIAALHLETFAERQRRMNTVTLCGRIHDEQGRLLPARLYVRDARGETYGPARFFYTKGHFYTLDGQFELHMPPGPVEVVALHGFEYHPAVVRVEGRPNSRVTVDLKLVRFTDLPARGWYAGEHHLHYKLHSPKTPGVVPEFDEACRVHQAEGLNFVSFKDGLDNAARCEQVATDRFIVHEDIEGRSHGEIGGHICFVNILRRPTGADLAFLDDAAQQGGMGIYTHPFGLKGALGDVEDVQISRDFPLALALGKATIWDTFWDSGERRQHDWDDHDLALDPHWDQRVHSGTVWMSMQWYRFLNLGFKLAGAGFTDSDLSLGVSPPPGSRRVYAQLKRLAWPDVIDAYRQGRTFITDGPLLLFTVDDQGPGAVLALPPAGRTVKVHVEAWGLDGVERVEIVRNGQVAATLGAKGGRIDATQPLMIDGTCWLAARCYGAPGRFFGRSAHTSPIYCQVGRQPMTPRPEDVAAVLRWLDTYRDVLPRFEAIEHVRPGVQNVRADIERARKIYESLLQQGRTWQ